MLTDIIIFVNKHLKHKSYYKLLILCFCLCISIQTVGCQTSSEYAELSKLPVNERHCEFSKLTLDKQIELYFAAMKREPPDTTFGIWIAQRGEPAIPKILEMFTQETEEYRKEQLLSILQIMHTYSYANVLEDPKTIALIKQQVAEMKDESWKRMSYRSVDLIEKGLVNKNPPSEIMPCKTGSAN